MIDGSYFSLVTTRIEYIKRKKNTLRGSNLEHTLIGHTKQYMALPFPSQCPLNQISGPDGHFQNLLRVAVRYVNEKTTMTDIDSRM